MPTRRAFIERVLRNVYGEQPSQDASETDNLVNEYIQTGIGLAARTAYRDSLQLDGIAYLNNSFYTSFKGLPFLKDENFLYKSTLPQIPFGIGKNEGVASVNFKSTDGSVSLDAIPLSVNQVGYFRSMKPISGKILYYPEGVFVYAISTLQLDSGYSASVRMASGGDSMDLDSLLNVPEDYIDIIFSYCVEKLRLERFTPKDITNDGNEN